EVDSPHVDPSVRKKHGQGIRRRGAPHKSGIEIPNVAMDHEESLVTVTGVPMLFLHHPMHTDAVMLIMSGRDHVAVLIDVVDYMLAHDRRRWSWRRIADGAQRQRQEDANPYGGHKGDRDSVTGSSMCFAHDLSSFLVSAFAEFPSLPIS